MFNIYENIMNPAGIGVGIIVIVLMLCWMLWCLSDSLRFHLKFLEQFPLYKHIPVVDFTKTKNFVLGFIFEAFIAVLFLIFWGIARWIVLIVSGVIGIICYSYWKQKHPDQAEPIIRNPDYMDGLYQLIMEALCDCREGLQDKLSIPKDWRRIKNNYKYDGNIAIIEMDLFKHSIDLLDEESLTEIEMLLQSRLDMIVGTRGNVPALFVFSCSDCQTFVKVSIIILDCEDAFKLRDTILKRRQLAESNTGGSYDDWDF